MNDLQKLCVAIAAGVPEATIAIDAPLAPNGAWWADIVCRAQRAIVEWKPDRGFGVSSDVAGYGEGADTVTSSASQALDRVLKLLVVR